MKFKKVLLWLTTALAGSAGVQDVALAESTAAQSNEVIVVGSSAPHSIGGLATQVKEAKDQFVVGHDFIDTRLGSANFAQLIDLTPGVSYFSEDAGGVLSGDIRVHGLDCNHVSILVDGAPVNDTGNYACFPGEYLPGDITDKITVNVGATDVDSPTASAVGGTVNVTSKLPDMTRHLYGKFGLGSNDYHRDYVEGDTGELGPWGTRAYVSANYTNYSKWKGFGDINREGLDARVYQPLGGKSFVSLAGSWSENRPYFYFTSGFSDLAAAGYTFDYNRDWFPALIRPGQADSSPFVTATSGDAAGGDTNYWRLHPNPVDFGTIRGQSLFDLGHHLTFTFDPFFFYTRANGGGATNVKETDPRLVGDSAAAGVDLNGDGDTKDTVTLYTPNNTRTNRIGLTSSLLFDLNESNRLQLAYTFDRGRHRQTGEFTFVNNLNGAPDKVFGGIDGLVVPTADGNFLRGRDRFSVALLNQISLNYLGKFWNDRVHVNIGARDPHFERDLNQFCYTFNGTSAQCDTIDPAKVLAAFNDGVAHHNATMLSNLLFGSPTTIKYNAAIGQPNFRFPFKETLHFDKALPNAGASLNVTENHLLYVSYAQGFSAPKTDDLYTSSPDLVKPETSTLYALGYRYLSNALNGSVNFWKTDYRNRIVQSFDPSDPTLSIDRNVGAVELLGADADIGWRMSDNWSFYASAEREHTDVKSDEIVSVNGVSTPVATKGKELVNTPKYTLAGTVQYTNGPVQLQVVSKYVGRRFMTDDNGAVANGYATFDFDAHYSITPSVLLRLNASNVLNRHYINRIATTRATAAEAGNVFFGVGQPASVVATLEAKF